MTIKIEFPADDTRAALFFGEALLHYSGALPSDKQLADAAASAATETETETVDDTPPLIETDLSDNEQAGDDTPDTDAAAVDLHGVAFDAEYCAQANDPYYSTGKRSGQWKKRRGVTDDVYDTWYATQRDAAAPAADTDEDVNTAAAFGAPTTADTEVADEPNAPADAGELMVWVSEMQNANRLTQDQVNNAYASTGIAVPTLFSGDNAAQNVATLYQILAAQVAPA